MALSATALITLIQAKNYLRIDAANSLIIRAESVGEGGGSDVTFSLANTPIVGSLWLYVANVLQVETTDYSISGADITFVTAPTNGDQITADYEYVASSDTFEEYADDEIETLIEAATKIAEEYSGLVFVQGTITEYHEGDGDKVLRLFKRPVDSITSVVRDISESKSDGDGSTTAYTLSEAPTSGSVKVYVDGALQTITTDYTISGSVVTFVSAPASGEKIAMTYTHTIIKISEYTEQLKKGKIIGAGKWAKGIIYTIVYIAGYASTRAATQALVPDAVAAVLLIMADLYNSRGDRVATESTTGLDSITYRPDGRSEKLLAGMRPLGGFV